MLMAKVKYSTMVESASGATGDDVVYSQWKGIKYVRSYARPAQPRTEKQVAQRTAFAEVVSAWHHLPAVVEMAWDVAAEGKPLSGYNLFMKRNLALQKQGKALIEVPDFSPPVPSVGAVQATSPSTGTLQVTWKDPSGVSEGKIYVYWKREADARWTQAPESPVNLGVQTLSISSLSAGTYDVALFFAQPTGECSPSVKQTGVSVI